MFFMFLTLNQWQKSVSYMITKRDSVGRLQNSFISMQRSLAQSVNNIQAVNAELEQHNDELNRADQLKLETNRRKAAFIQDMYHEIRTPLNIISGFAQVLATSLHGLPQEEVADITARMSQSAADITRLTDELGEVANSHD
jgi:sigma-B regulation protein RsbU (phosphoserine phosphatase)